MIKPIIVSGKRKMAVAKATIRDGEEKITINQRPYSQLDIFNRLRIEEPIRIAKEQLGELKFNIQVKVSGGGKEGQVEASRLAIARAIVEAVRQESKEKADTLKKAYTVYDRNLLVADTRRKEAYKPGDSKARAKRQKSYR
jgi:small subunit ribosomal protein S9